MRIIKNVLVGSNPISDGLVIIATTTASPNPEESFRNAIEFHNVSPFCPSYCSMDNCAYFVKFKVNAQRVVVFGRESVTRLIKPASIVLTQWNIVQVHTMHPNIKLVCHTIRNAKLSLPYSTL